MSNALIDNNLCEELAVDFYKQVALQHRHVIDSPTTYKVFTKSFNWIDSVRGHEYHYTTYRMMKRLNL